ncbi:Uncharacterized protein FWK35_00035687 [Aphis craccivora]|uniref:Uncharacterized protein n=1 Tax=Aphis craccivora TaxID=307492 RepID=A0A6G0Y6X8_APHCR|nr:Uncharacterized protein FWK35_00035687 [Aphis craccivora]
MCYDSERSDECIDFTMCVFFFVSVYTRTYRNNARISNFGGSFQFLIESSWCIGEVIFNFTIVFKSTGKNQKKIMENGNFYAKPVFDQIDFFIWFVIYITQIYFRFV